MLAVTVIGNIGNDAEIKEFNVYCFQRCEYRTL